MRALLCSLLTLALLGPAEAQTDGPVTLGGVTYERVDPGEAFTPAPQPEPDWTAPTPSRAETAAGMLAYVAPDPGDYRPDRIPRPAERVARLQTFLTPGEDEPVCFAVYALADLEALTLTVDAGAAPVTVDIRQMHCWPQRTGWKSRQWYITPELLLPCTNGRKTIPATRGVLRDVPFALGGGQSQGFWLTLHAPVGATAGRYTTTVSLSAEGKTPLRLPLEIEILPFALAKPAGSSWLLYCDAARWRTMTESQVLAELRDFARHGIDGLIEMPFGAPDLTQIKQGKVTFDAALYRTYATLCQQAGLAGPHVVGSPGPHAVRQALGLQADLNRGDWPAEVKAGVEAVARAAVEATRALPGRWYYYGVDEPTGENTFAIQDYQAWHAAGAPTYATFYVPSFLEKAAAFLTAPCFVVGLVSAEASAREAREACQKTGAEFFWYGTGSYVNPFPQERYMFHNRYGAGLLFWKTGARAQATWTFCRPHEDVFNDFDGSRANGAEPKEQVTAYPHLLQPDDYTTYQGAIPTIAWESLREGVDDYRYLHTLALLIGQAEGDMLETVRKEAQSARVEMEALVGSVPWANVMGPVAFETRRLQQVRRLTANRILRLRAAMQGGDPRQFKRSAQRATIRVSTVPGERRARLPTLAVPSTTQPPAIDGNLADPCWLDSAVAEGFADIRTGERSAWRTRALVLSDERALYVAFACPEPALSAVTPKEALHDGTVWLEDGVEFFIAGATRRPYAHLIVTSAGVFLDEINQDSQGWNPQVQVAVRRDGDRWCAEIALPWAELAKGGIRREPLMAMNFGRSRYTRNDPQTHTAWSTTYGGFHVPERFGSAFLPTGQLVLSQLQRPELWGTEELSLAVRNPATEAVTAEVGVAGAPVQTFALAGEATRTLTFPVRLTESGPQTLRLFWGLKDTAQEVAAVPITVPEPVVVPGNGDLLAPDSTRDWPIRLNLGKPEQASHKLMVRVHDGQRVRDYRLDATPGESLRLTVRSTAVSRLQVLLLDRRGQTVWQSAEQSFTVLPE